jgi:predicted RNA-binding Zn ribbon-like protein
VRLAWQFAQSTSLPELPLWLLSLSAAELMTSDEMDLLRACGDPECRWLFLDTSKNHTRRWCDMKICGNRMKARRFKAQHRT